MTNLVEGQFGHGALPHIPDPRDYQYSQIAKSAAPFDWDAGIDISPVEIKNQGTSGSCGGQAWSYFMGVLKADERSAKFIYAQTAVPGGGSDGRTNCDLVSGQGDCLETVLSSYENGNPPSEAYITDKSGITAAAMLNAATDRAFSYAQVNLDFDSIAQAIRDNKGVILGVDGENNNTWTTTYPQPPKTIAWRHWIYCCKAKMTNGKKFIGFANSWGSSVGDNGIQWIDESYLPHIFVAWTLYVSAGKFIFNADMQYGQTSNDIKELQKRLGVVQTGYYGSLTKQAVLNYQLANIPLSLYERFVLAGSICGARTRAALNK